MKDASLPLAGKRIVVTRPRHQAPSLSEPLRALGAEVVEAPAIEIAPPADPRPLDEALERLGTYHWVVFTSANGVESVFDRLRERSLSVPDSVSFAAIGPATAEALEARGERARIVPRRFVAEDVFRALEQHESLGGRRFLLPRADIAREALPRLLREAGAIVDVVVAYRTVAAEDVRRAVERVAGGEIDVVTFTSASTARSFLQDVDAEALRDKLEPASIGPITSAALAELGFPPRIEAERYTVDGLVDAIVRHYTRS